MKFNWELSFFYIINSIIIIVSVCFIIGTFKTPPKFEELEFFEGNIYSVKTNSFVRGGVYSETVLQNGNDLKIFQLPSPPIDKQYLDIGSSAIIGTWKDDIWNVEVDGKNIYSYSDRLERTVSITPLSRFLSIVIFSLYISAIIKDFPKKNNNLI